MIRDNTGRELLNHEEKADFIWLSFKERLGTLEFNGLNIDLDSLVNPSDNLDRLQEEFTKEEIKIIKDLPSHKSPGPDGFNCEFLKKCWPLIADEFYDLCKDFSDGEVCLRSINSSFITLIPKKDCPVNIEDFRPISLLNSSIKLLTKLLVERLQRVLSP
jgi:hypothetical protein